MTSPNQIGIQKLYARWKYPLDLEFIQPHSGRSATTMKRQAHSIDDA